jgi:hypothetical protein
MKNALIFIKLIVFANILNAQSPPDSFYLDTCSYICSAYSYMKYNHLLNDNTYIINDYDIYLQSKYLSNEFLKKYNLHYNFELAKKSISSKIFGCNCFLDPITTYDSLPNIISWYYEIDSSFKEIDSIYNSFPNMIVSNSLEDSLFSEFILRDDVEQYRQLRFLQDPILLSFQGVYYLDEVTVVVPIMKGYWGKFTHGYLYVVVFNYHREKKRWILNGYRL